ncbi:helix-turn-helix domain-containing protein [Zunongwangia sp. H14]|uniref:helix-turn-helix domain-containing protein n=1 Tax=Zunongwangia sp. H14 TaxID=3240792 RepID=UPI00356B4ACC
MLIALIGALSFYGYAQDETVTTSIPYEEIQSLESEALEEEDIEELERLVQVHLKKAAAENNDIEKARAFYYKTILEEPVPALAYADSIIIITGTSSHPNYPALGYALKGHLLYQSGDFQLALENYLEAYNLSLKKDNIEQQREFALAIAAIRNIYGQHYAAAELYNRSLNILKTKKDFENSYYEDYILLLYNLSLTHLRLHALDSARYYANQGIDKTMQLNDKANLQDFILLDAQINYYAGKYRKAKDTLLRYVGSLDGTSKAIKLYYLGKIEDKSNNRKLALQYYRDIDSIVTANGDPFSEIKDVYHQLMLNALAENDKKKQIEYMGKLIAYDSIHSAKQENVINEAMVSYDIPYLKHQKKEAEAQLQTKQRIIASVGLLALTGIVTGIYFYLRSVRMKKKLKLLLEGNTAKNRVSTGPVNVHPNSVPEDIRIDILAKLEKFEKSERFLDKDLDMATLAQELETNTSYLSVIINNYKNKSFPNYLKDLRIAKAIVMLDNDPILLKFNYQGLAETFGFKTGESFSKAFYKNTGIYPSRYIKELRSRKADDHL